MDASWNRTLHRRPPPWSALCTIFALATVLSNVVHGQTASTGALAGKVLDPSGAVIQKVEVRLTNPQTGDADTIMSDATGDFHFLLLPPGSYELQVSKTGFAPLHLNNINVVEVQRGESCFTDLQLVAARW